MEENGGNGKGGNQQTTRTCYVTSRRNRVVVQNPEQEMVGASVRYV